jgi:hypothetical protein
MENSSELTTGSVGSESASLSDEELETNEEDNSLGQPVGSEPSASQSAEESDTNNPAETNEDNSPVQSVGLESSASQSVEGYNTFKEDSPFLEVNPLLNPQQPQQPQQPYSLENIKERLQHINRTQIPELIQNVMSLITKSQSSIDRLNETNNSYNEKINELIKNTNINTTEKENLNKRIEELTNKYENEKNKYINEQKKITSELVTEVAGIERQLKSALGDITKKESKEQGINSDTNSIRSNFSPSNFGPRVNPVNNKLLKDPSRKIIIGTIQRDLNKRDQIYRGGTKGGKKKKITKKTKLKNTSKKRNKKTMSKKNKITRKRRN